MKIKRALTNTVNTEETDDGIDEQTFDGYQNYASVDQISFEVDDRTERLKRTFEGTKYLVKRRSEFFEKNPLWRGPSLAFAIISNIFVVLILLIGGLILFNRLPPQIQFTYDPIEKNWDRVDKVFIIIFPIFLLVFESIIIYFITEIFNNDKRLATVMSWMVTLVNLLLLFALGQIFLLNIPH